MIEIDIPDFGRLALEHLVLDYNGTLAVDGELIDGVEQRLVALADAVTIHVVTADTFGRVERAMAALPCRITVLGQERQATAKARFIDELGPTRCVAVGNGRNDRLMLEAAALGFAVINAEGAAAVTITAADVVTASIHDALDALLHPLRLVATLRS